MKNKDVNYPHPVLGIGDAVSPMPSIKKEPKIKQEKGIYHFHFDLEMHNEDILKLIQDEYAAFVCEVDCPSTFKRLIYKSKEPFFDIAFSKTDVAHRVNFDFTVTAIKSIKGYSNRQAHSDYQGISFDLDPGDILAFIGKSHYDADIQYDKLQSAGSFMVIDKGDDKNNTIYLLGKSKITILLPPTLFEDYRVNFNSPGKYANIFHSSLVLNALVYALMSYDEEQFGNTLWARTLKYRIELEPGLRKFSDTLKEKDPNDILNLAQALLANPYKRLFETMHNIIDQQTEQEGY